MYRKIYFSKGLDDKNDRQGKRTKRTEQFILQ